MRRSIVALLATVALAAGGCAPAPDTGDAAQPRFLSVGTAPQGGTFYVIGSALAEVLTAGEAGWQVTAEATKGSQENIRRLDKGEIDLALANSAITYFASRGELGWSRPYPVRTVMTLAPNVGLFIAPEGGGVESIPDLAGKRVVMGPAGAGFDFFLRPIIEAHGLTYQDFSPLHASQFDAVSLLGDGSASAAFLGGGVPTASITQAASSQKIRFLPYDPATVDALVAEYMFFNKATIPAGTYPGQDTEYHGMDVGSMHLIVAADTDEDLVYEITKTIFERRAEVVSRHAAGKAINAGNVVRDTGTPFHPGAIRYYRETGIWPEETSAP